jgi:hypothetical protein
MIMRDSRRETVAGLGELRRARKGQPRLENEKGKIGAVLI